MARNAPQPPSADDRTAAAGILGGVEAGLMPAPSNPMAVARELLLEHTDGEFWTLRHWRGDWRRWNGACWPEVEPAEIDRWLYAKLEHAAYLHLTATGEEERPWRPDNVKLAKVIHTLARTILIPESVEAPAWLGDEHEATPADELIAMRNGLLDTRDRKLHPHTPAFFNETALPFDYDPAAAEPVEWLRFLDQLWPDDPDAISALQDWFGYVLSGHTEQQKILLLVGPPRSGKGTIARVLQALVGKANHVSPTLAGLGTNFGLAPLIGRSLAVVSDARLSGKSDVATITERLLSVSGEDAQTIDRKYRDPWTGQLPARFMILSNELPRLGDASGAITGRFVTLMLGQTFLGREDVGLTRRLLSELPGILRWSLDGLDRLTERGAFVEPQSSADAVEALHELVSPVSAFVRDRCVNGGEVPVEQLFQAWAHWAMANGHHVGSSATLGRNLRAILPAVKTAQPRVNGVQVRYFVGVRLALFAPALTVVPGGVGRYTPEDYMNQRSTSTNDAS